jgi:hypothetical protein
MELITKMPASEAVHLLRGFACWINFQIQIREEENG